MPDLVTYSTEELLRLRRYDVRVPRHTRKAIFSLGLWRPKYDRTEAAARDRSSRRTADRRVVPCMFTANIRGGFAQKTEELEQVMRVNRVDVACITETWLSETVPSETVNVPGYVIHRNDRKDGRQCGGVTVFVRQDVPCQRLTALETVGFESVWLLYWQPRMRRYVSHVIVGAIYHPPDADGMAMTSHILGCLDIVARDHPQAGVVLLGDFN